MKELLEIIPSHEGYGNDKVIILEGSSSLNSDSAIMYFRDYLVENKIKHNVVYNLDLMDNTLLIDTIKKGLGCIIAFETTGISKSFDKVKQIIVHLSNNGWHFNLIECSYRGYFVVNRVPKEANQESIKLYHLDCMNEDVINWDLKVIN